MAAQIGFLLETTSADPRANAARAQQLPGVVGTGNAFRQSLNQINAEQPAERVLAQRAPIFASGLPARFASLVDETNAGEADIIPIAVPTENLTPRLAVEQTGTPSVPETKLSSEALTLPAAFDAAEQALPTETAAFSAPVADLKTLVPSIEGSEQPDLAPAVQTDTDARIAPAIESGEAVADSQVKLRGTAPSAEPVIPAQSGTSAETARSERPRANILPEPTAIPERIEINAENPIRPVSATDSDAPPASPQPRPAPRLSPVQVPAFTPFQQSAAATLPDSPDRPGDVPPTPATETQPTLGDTPRGTNSVAGLRADVDVKAPSTHRAPATAGQTTAETITPTSEIGHRFTGVETSKIDIQRPRQGRNLATGQTVVTADTPTVVTADTPTVVTADTPIAPPQQGTSQLAPQVPVPADTPLLQQNVAAVLPENTAAVNDGAATAEIELSAPRTLDATAAPDAKPTAETGPRGLTIDGTASDAKQIASQDSPLTSSQPGPAHTVSRVQIPAATPLHPQTAATMPQAQLADIPNVLSDSLKLEDGSKRITVQLDPPELGRVSIDFKFDGNVLQNVVVTGETQEAMRRLRLMHFELVQTLESHGFSGQELDFSQRGDDRRSPLLAQDFEEGSAPFSEDDPVELANYERPTGRQSITQDGLDLKL